MRRDAASPVRLPPFKLLPCARFEDKAALAGRRGQRVHLSIQTRSERVKFLRCSWRLALAYDFDCLHLGV
jgi:hypothetical protein